MEDLKELMKQYFVKYASYVIGDRAIPHVLDGLKPVQRRILHTLYRIHDGKLHKVANVAGQTMAYHPHGDAPIYEALTNMANKEYLLDRQGNFGNIFTGDPAAAARYIETRLSSLATETMFNPDLTTYIPSYDGRAEEPIILPAKIPILLMHGIDGIAVGMATHILPHNFCELLKAEIAILEGKKYKVLPDFPTGGIMDASQYDHGKGKVKLRAKIDIKDAKTIVIKEICYGTTTDSLIRSIDEAAKKGKIKIEAINDYTASKVEIEITLPRGQYANEAVEALYAYTECEVIAHSQIVVIRDNLPWEPTVEEVLELHVATLKGYLQKELEIKRDRLLEKIFQKTLEQIFIENRLYKHIEEVATWEKIHETIATSVKPYHKMLLRVPTEEDREKLLQIPIRRISRFDRKKNEEEITSLQEEHAQVEKDLKDMVKFTINHLQNLLDKYGKLFPRKTKVDAIEEVDRELIKTKIQTKRVKVALDPATGFVGTKVQEGRVLECTNFDKILLLFDDGTYTVMNIPEKQYVQAGKKAVYLGVADKKTVLNVIYHEKGTLYTFAKRFIVSKFILDKEYRFLEEGVILDYLSDAENPKVIVQFKQVPRQKSNDMEVSFKDYLVKGVTAGGVRLAKREFKKIAKDKNAQPDLFHVK